MYVCMYVCVCVCVCHSLGLAKYSSRNTCCKIELKGFIFEKNQNKIKYIHFRLKRISLKFVFNETKPTFDIFS